ncbi:MAG TPA: hypothetical protein VNQ90_17750 [Chthoniobacteraceae bacterium]|nr:hypothetical protein [Chthoniobacteraceae bacterium]
MKEARNPVSSLSKALKDNDLHFTSGKVIHPDAETVTIILPLPAKRLSPNCVVATRGGRFAKASAVKRYRAMAKEAVEAACVETGPWERALATVTFFWPDNRRRDEDNAVASLKAAYDGIVDAGLIVDDNSRHLRREMPVFAIDRASPRVEIVVSNLHSPGNDA